MANINDVAKVANVSKSTVSNVFNNKKNVSEEVKKKVFEVANELGYYPNKLASALTTKKTGLVGLFIDNNQEFRQMDNKLIEGVSIELNKINQHMILYLKSSYIERNNGENINKQLITEPIDGAIIVAPMFEDVRINELISLNKRIVLIGSVPNSLPGVMSVDVNNVRMTYEVTRKLIEQGHRKIAFINSEPNLTISIDRMKGYLKALKETDIEYNPEVTFHSDNSEMMGYELGVRIFRGLDITAIICSSDLVGSGIYKAAKELDMSIPDDISVFALGGTDNELIPRLNTIFVDYEELGKSAVSLLVDESGGVKKVLQSYQLRVLDSVSRIKYVK